MSNFGQALECMKAGGAARLPQWDDDAFISIKEGKINYECILHKEPQFMDILSEEWELIEGVADDIQMGFYEHNTLDIQGFGFTTADGDFSIVIMDSSEGKIEAGMILVDIDMTKWKYSDSETLYRNEEV